MVINNNSDSTRENGSSFNASDQANDALLINFKQKENEVSSTGQADGGSSNRLLDVTLVGEDLAGIVNYYFVYVMVKIFLSFYAKYYQFKIDYKN